MKTPRCAFCSTSEKQVYMKWVGPKEEEAKGKRKTFRCPDCSYVVKIKV